MGLSEWGNFRRDYFEPLSSPQLSTYHGSNEIFYTTGIYDEVIKIIKERLKSVSMKDQIPLTGPSGFFPQKDGILWYHDDLQPLMQSQYKLGCPPILILCGYVAVEVLYSLDLSSWPLTP